MLQAQKGGSSCAFCKSEYHATIGLVLLADKKSFSRADMLTACTYVCVQGYPPTLKNAVSSHGQTQKAAAHVIYNEPLPCVCRHIPLPLPLQCPVVLHTSPQPGWYVQIRCRPLL